jgi:hypothetical protein
MVRGSRDGWDGSSEERWSSLSLDRGRRWRNDGALLFSADGSFGRRRRRRFRQQSDRGRGSRAPLEAYIHNGRVRRSWKWSEVAGGGEGIDGGAPVELEAGCLNASIAAASYYYGGGGVG